MIFSIFIAVALLSSVLWAFTAPIPRDVCWYFFAQLIYTLITQPAMYFLGTKSPVYAVIYSFFTFLILFSMAKIVASKYETNLEVALSWMVGAINALIILAALPKPIHYYNVISLFEAVTLTACGVGLIFNAKNSTYLALAILWVSMAAYRLCYTYEIGNPAWKSLNSRLPAALCIIAFTFIGTRYRIHSWKS